jgi:hypothetical protein
LPYSDTNHVHLISSKPVTGKELQGWVDKTTVTDVFSTYLHETLADVLMGDKTTRDALYHVTTRGIHYWILAIQRKASINTVQGWVKQLDKYTATLEVPVPSIEIPGTFKNRKSKRVCLPPPPEDDEFLEMPDEH